MLPSAVAHPGTTTAIAAATALALTLALVPACSFATVPPPPNPPPPPGAPVQCVDSNSAPVLDLVAGGTSAFVGLGFLLAALLTAAVDIDPEEDDTEAAALALVGAGGVGASAGFFVSGFVGAVRTSDCRQLKQRRAPVTQPPGWTPPPARW